jgi:hypothetical protein
MKKNVIFMICLIGIIGMFIVGCKTKPDTKDQKDTKTETKVETKTTADVTSDKKDEKSVDKVTDDEMQHAVDLINRAKQENAAKYDPENLKLAEDALKNAIDARMDVVKARGFLKKAEEYANKAYENSLKGQKIDKVMAKKDDVDKLYSELEALSGDKLLTEPYKESKKIYDQANDELKKEDYEKSYDTFVKCEKELTDLIAQAKDMRKYFEEKIELVKGLIGEADKLGARIYAKEDFEKANTSLEAGINTYTELKFDESKNQLTEAENAVNAAIDKTNFALKELKRKEAVKAIKEAGKSVEKASKQPVLNSGDKKENNQYKFEFNENDRSSDLKKNLSNAPDENAVSFKEILAKSIEYIEKAKEAYRIEDYDLAIEYADTAKKLAESYKGSGVKTTYEVKFRKFAKDCLWRISGYSYIYNNPQLWPRIWKANKDIITNPDLIFPGQVLIIPEME